VLEKINHKQEPRKVESVFTLDGEKDMEMSIEKETRVGFITKSEMIRPSF